MTANAAGIEASTERSEVKPLVLQFLFIVSEKADRTYEKNCKSMSNKLTKNGG